MKWLRQKIELFKLRLASRWAANHGLSLLRVSVKGNTTYVHGPNGQMFTVGRNAKRGQ